MPQIRIEQPGAAPVLRVLSGSETTLGRAEDNDVVLVADEVSRHHAKLCIRGGRVLLMDLNSLNGTYVNRQQIVERVLSHQDEIWFGSKCRILFDENPKIASRTANELPEPSSVLVNDLARIREDMARVGNNMTLIGKAGQAARAGDETPSASKEELVAMGRAYRRLAALYQASNQVSRLIASNADLPTRLAAVLDTAIEVAEAERGFVMLRDEQSGGLLVHLAREMGQELKASSPSMSIASRAASMGEPVLMRDSALDEQFGSSDSIIAQRIHSAMCAPLQVEDRILGSIYVDTRQPEHMFQEEDLELFASLAAQSAMAIENVRLSEQMLDTEKKRANLGRFLSPAIVEAIMNEDKELELGGAKAGGDGPVLRYSRIYAYRGTARACGACGNAQRAFHGARGHHLPPPGHARQIHWRRHHGRIRRAHRPGGRRLPGYSGRRGDAAEKCGTE